MVFKRRDTRPIWKIVLEFLWPRGGWKRAASYVLHRMRRLPDNPHRIARGIAAGVFTTFTPFYGMHFVTAAILAICVRGNILAAILGTFFGNPLTYVPITVVSLKTGHFLLGSKDEEHHRHFFGKFADAWHDLKVNFIAIFNDTTPQWSNLQRFYDGIFLPYMVGGVLPGLLCAIIAYYLCLPLIEVYQNRRRGVLREKLAQLKKLSKRKDKAPGAE